LPAFTLPGEFYTADNETSLAHYSVTQLLVPLITVFRCELPHVKFAYALESKIVIEMVQPTNRKKKRPNFQPAPTAKAECYLDLVLIATYTDPGTKIEKNQKVLIVEFKRPNSLRRADFATGLSSRRGALISNAKRMAGQARKYMAAANWPIVTIFDGMALAGIKVGASDVGKLNTREVVRADVFFEDGKEKFLDVFLAITILGLKHAGFLI
jgi:hypothetical protein